MKFKFFYIFVVTFLFATTSLYAKENAIVDLSWLKKNMNLQNLVIVDLREPGEFEKGHIKGAVNIYAYKKLFAEGYLMPGLNELKETFESAGIGSSSFVVAYDNGDFIWAARLYWILETLGHKDVSMLNVGYGNWESGEIEISTKRVEPKRAEFVPKVDNSKLETKLGTSVAVATKSKQIVDGRAKPHYLGEESIAKRFGHIPGAKNYQCTHNFEVTKSGAKLKELNDLKSHYEDLKKDKEIILYCDGGAEAALNYVILQELGYKVSVYDGSWLEWGNDVNLPIENPSLKEGE